MRIELSRQAETPAKAHPAGEIRQATLAPAARQYHAAGWWQCFDYHFAAPLRVGHGTGQRLAFPGAAQPNAMGVHESFSAGGSK